MASWAQKKHAPSSTVYKLVGRWDGLLLSHTGKSSGRKNRRGCVVCLWGSLRQCMLKRQCTDLPASSTGGCRSSNLIHTTVTTLRSSTATASASAASAAASGPPPNHPSARLRSSLFASAQGSETVRGKIMSAQYTHSGEAKK